MHRVQVIAHRGARSLAPENTLAAAAKAYEVGADSWECDVAVTSDGELILFHDDSLARTTDAEERFPNRSPWTFTTFTATEIHELDAGSWYVEEDPYGEIKAGLVTQAEAAAYRGEHVPTVTEALDCTKSKHWRINLELKRLPPPMQDFPVVDRVLDLIAKTAIPADEVIISSFRHDWLHQVEARRPDIEVQALVGYSETKPISWDHIEFHTYNARYTLVTPAKVRELIDRGLAINLFTVNDEADWRRYIEAGVSGIITDYPQDLLALLRRLGPNS